LDRANQALGIETLASAVPQPVVVVPVVPPVPVLETKAVEVSSLTFEPRPRSHDDSLTFPLRDPIDRVDFEKRDDLRKVRKALQDSEREWAERRRRRRTWNLETVWPECLIYPFRAWPLLVGLAAAWATMTAFLIGIWPAHWGPAEIVPRAPLMLFVVLLLGFTVASLEATIAGGTAGHAGYVVWPANDLGWTAAAGVRALICFLAGPIIPALVAFFFWLQSGDLELVDKLIIWELCLVAAGYWTLALLTMRQRTSFRHASPLAIVEFVKRRGFRPVLAASLAAFVMVSIGGLALKAVEELHRSGQAWLWLVFLWTAQLFALVFLFRWLGVSWFYARKKRPDSESAGPKDVEKDTRGLSAGFAS